MFDYNITCTWTPITETERASIAIYGSEWYYVGKFIWDDGRVFGYIESMSGQGPGKASHVLPIERLSISTI